MARRAARAVVQRVTADSNVIISALMWRGNPHRVLEMARRGEIEMAISDPILDEVSRILRDKFEWSADQLQELRAEMATFTRHVTPTETLDAVPRDRDDNKILECAVAAGSEVIVSGDLDLLSLGSFRGIRIQRPADFLAEGRAR